MDLEKTNPWEGSGQLEENTLPVALCPGKVPAGPQTTWLEASAGPEGRASLSSSTEGHFCVPLCPLPTLAWLVRNRVSKLKKGESRKDKRTRLLFPSSRSSSSSRTREEAQLGTLLAAMGNISWVPSFDYDLGTGHLVGNLRSLEKTVFP